MMSFILVCMMLFTGRQAGAETQHTLPEDPLTQKAKDAYNQGEYAEAVRYFRAIARKHSTNVVIYRELARSLSWADEPESAIHAYWQYLDLAPKAADREKVNAELGLLLRRVKTTPSKETPAAISAAFDAIQKQVRAGRFTGQTGALGALDTILKSKYITPRIAEAEGTIRAGLQQHSIAAIDAWWNLEEQAEKNTLTELVTTWEVLTEKGPLRDNERRLMVTLDGLTHLSMKEYAKAAQLLGSVAPGHPRLRYAHALALIAHGKDRQAAGILKSLAQGDADARIHTLLGLAQNGLRRGSGVDALVQALTSEGEEDAP